MKVYQQVKFSLISGLIFSLLACGKSIPSTELNIDTHAAQISLIQESLNAINKELQTKIDHSQIVHKKVQSASTKSSKLINEASSHNKQPAVKNHKHHQVKKIKSTQTINYPKATPFKLEDQNGDYISFNYPREKLAIIAMADKDGSDQMENWITPLYQRYTDKIDIFGIAELSIVPGFARGIVKAIFTTQLKTYPIMLDWKGDVTRAYNYQKKHTNLFIVDSQGNIHGKIVGPVNQDNLNQVVKLIDKLFKSQ